MRTLAISAQSIASFSKWDVMFWAVRTHGEKYFIAHSLSVSSQTTLADA
jgi:hypothetical protein